MKKIGYIFLLFFVLLFGISLVTQDETSHAQDVQDRIEEFEKNIDEHNNIDLQTENIINPNIINKSAKGCEKIINSIIDEILGMLK